MGLGLYIVNEIVQAHRGTIEVGGSFGEGAELSVCLPKVAPPTEISDAARA